MPPRIPPAGIPLSSDIEFLKDRPTPYRARLRWVDPVSRERRSASESLDTEEAAEAWIERLRRLALAGVDPGMATMPLGEYGDLVMDMALRGLEKKTTDPYMAGWRLRVKPYLGHLPVHSLTYGAVDRTVYEWIEDGAGRSTIKCTIAVLVRVMQQAQRDGLVETNPARISGWQHAFRMAEDELDNPRELALRDWAALDTLADALVRRSHGDFGGWGDVVRFAGCTAARIGEVSGVRLKDIDTREWMWNLCRQTTPSPGGLVDKGTKGKRRRWVPIIPQVRPLVLRRIALLGPEPDPMARLFTGPRGGRITTAVLRDATHWDEVVAGLGYEFLRRHDLRHTGLTWMADAGIPVHVLRKIAGHGSLSTTQRYLHPARQSIIDAGGALQVHLDPAWSTNGPQMILNRTTNLRVV
ncbi:tyrosine-type recombinase/integrase [Embleya sp. NPDC059237]|uniref:tyrosine-type recombinase/integrase n=1 Tax=Embleya sp. NPDC059237 TaxID=3346784 RepID=UPI0036A2F26E